MKRFKYYKCPKKLALTKCPVCGYFGFNGYECFDCGYKCR